VLIDDTLKKFGPPKLRLEGFQVWVHGWQFPHLYDYWDGNWLRATAHCGVDGASVFSTGAILHLSELASWRNQLELLSRTLLGEAKLNCIEPYLGVILKADSLGHVLMEVSITPEHLTQRHWFQFEIDQTYLNPLLRQLHSLFDEYPLRGGL
jgi:hypothetical protein